MNEPEIVMHYFKNGSESRLVETNPWFLLEQLNNWEKQVAEYSVLKIWGKICVMEGCPVFPKWIKLNSL